MRLELLAAFRNHADSYLETIYGLEERETEPRRSRKEISIHGWQNDCIEDGEPRLSIEPSMTSLLGGSASSAGFPERWQMETGIGDDAVTASCARSQSQMRLVGLCVER